MHVVGHQVSFFDSAFLLRRELAEYRADNLRGWSTTHVALRHNPRLMPNIASALKSEISRIARKEIKSETTQLKRAVGDYRSQIAALKRRAHALEQQLRSLDKLSAKASRGPREETNEEVQDFRFSAKGLASHRKRLGLSAAECGILLGASGQSIYKWEDGKARPRAKHMPAIAALRTLGRKQAAEILASRS